MFYSRDACAMPDAFADELVDLRPRLVAFARSLASNADEAEDLAQETLVRAVAAREHFRPNTNLRAWVFTILRNVHLNRRRAELRRPTLVELDPEADATTVLAVDAEVIARSEAADVLQMMRRLPPVFAAPLHLLAVEQLSYAEIAQTLGVPIGTVMSRVYRARRLLAAWLCES
ncbi:MAG: RNA polymerase sigma factor, partial [Candidatus Dormibacteria bacterium]